MNENRQRSIEAAVWLIVAAIAALHGRAITGTWLAVGFYIVSLAATAWALWAAIGGSARK